MEKHFPFGCQIKIKKRRWGEMYLHGGLLEAFIQQFLTEVCINILLEAQMKSSISSILPSSRMVVMASMIPLSDGNFNGSLETASHNQINWWGKCSQLKTETGRTVVRIRCKQEYQKGFHRLLNNKRYMSTSLSDRAGQCRLRLYFSNPHGYSVDMLQSDL